MTLRHLMILDFIQSFFSFIVTPNWASLSFLPICPLRIPGPIGNELGLIGYYQVDLVRSETNGWVNS